ncbi:carboxypeptidase regulatory-like domain-containing protein [Streptomyces sp. NBC_01190]|uniref:carboxypeptidase regulatory-like domain-containing protein n=1 Tax=Streptomyces sp. NBC_01190 TaxID=2903767 RepID=UPI00386607BC|nr:carboxypeptidase regulatory-like domain-containing protein [Streptomyces sp. NBC_01190]
MIAAAVLVLGLQAPAAQAATASQRSAGRPAASGGTHAAKAGTHAAKAGTPTGTHTPTAQANTPTGRPDSEPVCHAPQPGTFTCFALRRTDVTAHRGLVTGDTAPEGFGAGDLQAAYGLPADGGSGQTIAIVDAFDDPNAAADLAVYRAQYGLPGCAQDTGCFRKVDQRGGADYPTPDPEWSGEISLDLDMVSAAAPNAHILLVEADSNYPDDLAASVDQAVAMGAKYVSNSYGGDEDPRDSTLLDASYTHPGVAIVASTGDESYGVEYPAASQHVTAVGGTSLTRDAGSARGWSESAWSGAGSGCSAYQPKPAFQHDGGCANRTVADVAAVADPDTGVSVYQTYGGTGWDVYGGTSASAPLIAGVYAAAGTPTAGTEPNAYPYLARGSGLNDVTSGSNGTCAAGADYLCDSGTGYDGPTGLGTPAGVTAFRNRPHGVISGTVTDAKTGAPIVGAAVGVDSDTATTDTSGRYQLVLPTGTYAVLAAAFGHKSLSATGVTLADGAGVRQDFALTAVATKTVSGTVTDGSGHGWPLYAKITIDGVPGGPLWTDPVTGAYSVALPKGADYTLHVTSAYPGYEPASRTVSVAATAVTANIALTVDDWNISAPGYAVDQVGRTETFDSTTSAPADWSVVNAEGDSTGWEFDDPGARGNNTGGDGSFAIVDSDHYGYGPTQDSSLLSPVFDLAGDDHPEVAFATDYRGSFGQTASVDVSTDGGASWDSVWTPPPAPMDLAGPAKIEVPLTPYAGQKVQVRFHYTGNYSYWWKIDDVFVGDHRLKALPGGLIAGAVTDANTGKGVTGVSLTGVPRDTATTVATPDDPTVADGFYWLFSPAGQQKLTAAKYAYTTATKKVTVIGDSTVDGSVKLKAGQLVVTPGAVTASVGWGKQATKTLTVKNTGGAPATLRLKENAGRTTIAASQGAALSRVKASGWLLSAKKAPKSEGPTVTPAVGDAWQPAPDLPVPAQDNAVDSFNGKLYSGFGFTGSADSSALYSYDPKAGAWSRLAPATDTREAPAHGFIDGKLYVVGGWAASGNPDSTMEVYDPAANTWSTGTPSPAAYAGAGSAVLDGKLYVVGGCTAGSCGTDSVSVYDAAAGTWSFAADYPVPTAWSSCAGIDGKLYCAGGATDDGDLSSAYVYDPAANSWSALPDLPEALWGSAYTSANGLLLISGGTSGNFATNEGFAYDPAANSWSALPNASQPAARSGGAAGFYKVGGVVNSGEPLATVELLPGYDQVEGADASWLSESTRQLTVQPGAAATVTLTLDSSVAEVGQPGTYTAELQFSNDTPYLVDSVPVTLTVAPPASWGKLSGTVLGSTAGVASPLAGATVEVDSWTAEYTLTTGKDGGYELWLDQRNNPLTVIVAKDGYKPTVATVKVVKGKTVITDFTLKKA